MEPWMADVAAEELRALESEHPGRFDFLKHEIRAFVAESRVRTSSPPPDAAHFADTQVSSTDDGDRRRKRGTDRERRRMRRRTVGEKDSADLALERAAECLRKIRKLKESLACW